MITLSRYNPPHTAFHIGTEISQDWSLISRVNDLRIRLTALVSFFSKAGVLLSDSSHDLSGIGVTR